MATPPPIRTELFRFLSFKSPQLSQRATRKYWFVSHPAPGQSHFLKGLEGQSLDQARRSVARQADSFKSVGSKDALIARSPELYAASQWLFAQRGSQIRVQDLPAARNLTGLSGDIEVALWDELFNQLQRRSDAPLRQASIQMLITLHVMNVLRAADLPALASQVIQTPRSPEPPTTELRIERFLRRLLQAKLIIPPAFSTARSLDPAPDKRPEPQAGTIDRVPSAPSASQPVAPGAQAPRKPAPRELQALQRDHLSGMVRDRQARWARLDTDMTEAVRSGTLSRDGLAALPAAAGEERRVPPRLRRFLDQSETRGANLRKARLQMQSRASAEGLRALPPENGVDRDLIAPHTFVVSHDAALEGEGIELSMTLQAPYDDAYVKQARYSLTTDKGRRFEGQQVREIATSPRKQITLQLFPDQPLPIADDQHYRLEAEFTLDDGQRLHLDTEGALAKDRSAGMARSVAPGSLPAPDLTPTPRVDPQASTVSAIAQPAPARLYGVNRLGIGVFRKVEQEVCCYVPGEVSHIENIMAREYKERHTRSLNTTETTTEDTLTSEVEQQSDTSTAQRNELASEVANVLSNQTTTGFNANTEVSGKYGGLEFSAGAAFDYGLSNGSSNSNADARSYAEEVTRSALDRVLQNSTSKRTSRMLQEYEENNRHGYDNRKGDKHVTGVYRWVDILYRNRLINYGKHLMLEFLVPDPAAFYRKAMNDQKKKGKKGADSDTPPVAPKTLGEAGVTSPLAITRSSYSGFARQFDVTLEAPAPEEGETVSLDLKPGDAMGAPRGPDGKKNESFQFKIMLPPRYQLDDADFTVRFQYTEAGANTGTYMKIALAGKESRDDDFDNTGGLGNKEWHNMPFRKSYDGSTYTQQVTLQLDMTNVFDFSIFGELTTTWSDFEEASWQERCYAALQTGYDRQYDQYTQDLAAWEADQNAEKEQAQQEAEQGQDLGTSASMNRDTEQQELKRSAIEMMMRPYGYTLGQDFLEPGGCGVPSARQDAQWEFYSSQIKFFEQSFEWGAMAYIFYPYYWADRCEWEKLLKTESSSDPLFTNFLRSGMARVVVPVRRGFEEALAYYLDTGDIWLGGDLVLETEDELYLSVAEELREIEGFVEDEWETRVPTTLTIVQGESVYLDDQGLPCCEPGRGETMETGLKSSTALLEGLPRAS